VVGTADSPRVGKRESKSFDDGMEILGRVMSHLEQVGDLARTLHLVEDAESEESGEALTVGRALEKRRRIFRSAERLFNRQGTKEIDRPS
jgi:hypothetical protein